MATASELKVKVTKILTIVEYLEDENINIIEKDILLQAVRELYSDILVTDTAQPIAETPNPEDETTDEQQKSTEKTEDNVAENAVAAAVVPPVIAVSFDDGEFDFSDLLNDKEDEDVSDVCEQNEDAEEKVEPASEDIVDEEEHANEEEAEPEEENEEPAADYEMEELDEQDFEDVDDADLVDEIDEEDTIDENLDVDDDIESDVQEEYENVDRGYEETISGDTEVKYSFEEKSLHEEQPAVDVEDTVAEESRNELDESVDEIQEEIPVEDISVEEEFVEETSADEIPLSEETIVEVPQNVEEKPVEQEKTEQTRITLGEQLGQSRQSSLNDKFASNKPAEGSFGLKPISDIKSAIPLGERFRFTRMLFSGNGPAFDSTVAALNGMSSIEEADNYVRTNFRWDMDSPVVVDFMNIVRRRYM